MMMRRRRRRMGMIEIVMVLRLMIMMRTKGRTGSTLGDVARTTEVAAVI